MTRKIVFIGGDKRELTVMEAMLAAGHSVEAYAFPPAALPPGARDCPDPQAALAQADACVLPLPPLREDALLHHLGADELHLEDGLFAQAPAGLVVLTGIATPYLQCIAPRAVVVGLLDSEDLAQPLAEATAEGALAEAIRLSEGMLWGQQALVIGYGRIGRALAWRLEGLGMQVVVLNRGAARAEEARELGMQVGDWSQLTAIAAQSAFIFNTAPGLVLGRSQLQWLRRDALIVDLAATPGGVDFAAAAELGLRAVLAGGLPGRYSPRFAGQVMAAVYQRRLELLWGEEKA